VKEEMNRETSEEAQSREQCRRAFSNPPRTLNPFGAMGLVAFALYFSCFLSPRIVSPLATRGDFLKESRPKICILHSCVEQVR